MVSPDEWNGVAWNRVVLAIDLETSELRWEQAVPLGLRFPVVVGETVMSVREFTNDKPPGVVALDRQSGTPQWEYAFAAWEARPLASSAELFALKLVGNFDASESERLVFLDTSGVERAAPDGLTLSTGEPGWTAAGFTVHGIETGNPPQPQLTDDVVAAVGSRRGVAFEGVDGVSHFVPTPSAVHLVWRDGSTLFVTAGGGSGQRYGFPCY